MINETDFKQSAIPIGDMFVFFDKFFIISAIFWHILNFLTFSMKSVNKS